MKTNSKIAVVVYNCVQLLNILPGIEELIKLGYCVDFYGLLTDDKTGFQDLFSDVINQLRKKGYNVYTKARKIKYKILLEPYESNLIIDAQYKIRFRYSQITAKPDKVYIPYLYMKYDCILCSGPYSARLLNNYTNTEIVSDLKYINFKRKKHDKGKKVLLYLPTYGKECSIDLIAEELNKLRNDYYVIVKIHHGTKFLVDEAKRIDKVKVNVDEFYDLHKELKELLEIADVVLTDNSASVFDAIYNNIPVAIFTNDINQNKLGDFNTIQYELYKEGIIPYTQDINKIPDILKKSLSSKIIQKQNEWNEKNFYHSKDPIKDFVKVIEKYLNDDIDRQSYLLRRKLHDDFLYYKDYSEDLWTRLDIEYKKTAEQGVTINNLNSTINNLNTTINNLNSSISEKDEKISNLESEIEELERELSYYRDGKLYKLAKKVYQIKNGGE